VCKRANIGNSVWGFISRGRTEIRYWPDTTMCKQINNIIADWILPCKQKLWIRIKLIHTPKAHAKYDLTVQSLPANCSFSFRLMQFVISNERNTCKEKENFFQRTLHYKNCMWVSRGIVGGNCGRGIIINTVWQTGRQSVRMLHADKGMWLTTKVNKLS